MADVRSLLKTERASRRIQHKYASYTPTGTLLCIICHLQLKSESLWDGHLRSAGHIIRVQKAQEIPESRPDPLHVAADNKKKRKAIDDEGDTGTLRKKTRATNGLPGGFFDQGGNPLDISSANPINEIRIPSRPATPLKLSPNHPQQPTVDESEWAAFEADIASAEVPDVAKDAVIIAKPVTAAELASQSREDAKVERKERAEAELEGDKEDAARKMEVELEEMESLEMRVRRLRERREALREKEGLVPVVEQKMEVEIEEEDDDNEDDDDWVGFRMKG